ncbi:hypothetical protein [Paenibacillus sp. KN14-4R]|uniref:hypothetical protein n=1 Tax=Paenibacillus sp. KN14-4R TaxID=3445773 RepID=UPI003FA1749F
MENNGLQKIIKEEIVKLAAMECAASCVLTLLNKMSFEIKDFLINYWNLNYTGKILMGARNVRLFDLEKLYGIRVIFTKSTKEQLLDFLSDGGKALYLCNASGFSFFPDSMLGYESSGFKHFTLLYGLDKNRQVMMVDPIIDFIDSVSFTDLLKASVGEHYYYYYALVFPKTKLARDESQSLDYSMNRNFHYYMESKLHGGRMAIERFLEDLVHSIDWPEKERKDWVTMNITTVNAIANLRRIIWGHLKDLLPIILVDKFTIIVNEIVELWKNVIFQLIKYNRSPQNMELINYLKGKITAVAKKEEFLLYQLVEWRSEKL